jgi:hypothetical protein
MGQFIITTAAALIIGFGVGYDYGYGEKWGSCEPAPNEDKLLSSIRNLDGSTTCTYAVGYGQATYQTKRFRK